MLLAATLPLLASLPATPVHGEDFLGDSPPLPEILTATRLRQAPAAVPGSMSVIDAGLIKSSGARTLSELMRLVPGMLVVPSGNLSTVNYHGSNAAEARRMQVLVDGRSVYRPAFAQVDWTDIPLALEDIERIEVFRGPNTVSYGANALMAVINILTKAPSQTHGTRLKVTRGQRGINDWFASQGMHWDSSDMRLSLSGIEDDGFDDRADGSDFRDGKRLSRFNLSLTQELDPSQTLDWQLSLKEANNQVNNNQKPSLPTNILPGEADDDSDVRSHDYAGSLKWDKAFSAEHSLQVQTHLQHWERLRDWRTCDAQLALSPQLGQLWNSSPEYTYALLNNLARGSASLPTGTAEQAALARQVQRQAMGTLDRSTGKLAHTCGNINENFRETRFDLEIQDTLSLTEDLRLLSGASYRHDVAESETYFGDSARKDTWRLFGHLEWYITEHWLLQGGSMYERDSMTGDSLTPRVALNYLITPSHGLRAVYSEAIRSPDMFENDGNWSFRVRDMDPAAFGQRQALFFPSARGPGNLEEERIRSHELGYNGHFASIGLSVDIKAFYDEIDDLISEPLKINNFKPTNDNNMQLRGAETEADWKITANDRLRLTYAYLEVDASSKVDTRLTPRHSGSAGWMRNWGYGWNSSLFYYGADALNGYRFERVDARVAKRIPVAGTEIELAGILQQRLDDEPLSMPNNNYDERRVTWLTAEVDF
ncbi:Colicin I receptor precursor [compost metagenome]